MAQDPHTPDRFSSVFAPPPPQKTSLLRKVRGSLFKIIVGAVVAQLAITAIVLTAIVVGATIETLGNRKSAPADIVLPMTDVHSMVVNPTDGSLYAATVRGLFRVESADRAVRIAEDYLSATGLIAVGPDEFYAGGRPDLRDRVSDKAPDEAGLIHTTDAGHSWQTVSLRGEALLTLLSLADDRLYAYNELTQSLLLSEDLGQAWETRSQPGALRDLVTNPDDATQLLATTEDQLIVSSDGGATWQPSESPGLSYLEWPDEALLWGVSRDGAIYESQDDGATWQPTGEAPGGVHAFYASGSLLYVALDDDRVMLSSDEGRSWALRYAPPPRE